MGGIDAAGDVTTGAAWARAVEPLAGEAPGAARHGACLNCGTALNGRYCHACGQSSHVHRTLMSIVHDLLHGVFHFEGKIWRTLPMLVLRPGELTRRYIDGERAKFVSPLALFLFTVFLLFASFSALGPSDLGSGLDSGLNKGAVEVERARRDIAAATAKALRDRAALVASGTPTATIDGKLDDLRKEGAALATVRERLVTEGGHDVTVKSNIAWLDAGLKKARANPGLIIYKVQSAAYKFSWALILLSTPLVALLFLWRRRFGLYDHATFVTYSITFMSLLMIVLELLLSIDAPGLLLAALVLLVPPAHMFVQVRGAYRLSVFSALWRTVLLMAFAVLALQTFALGVIAMEVVK